MKKSISTTMLMVTALAFVNCAAKNPMLQDARKSYDEANKDPTVKENAPVALHEAGLALQKANTAQANREDKEQVNHLALLASKRVEIAKIEAQRKVADSKFKDVAESRTDVVLSAREKEADEARQKADMLQKQLDDANTQNQGQKDALNAKNETLQKELAALKMKQTSRGMEMTLKDAVFEFNKAELTPGALRDIEKLSKELKNAPDRKILVEGHTDGIGTAEYNQALSQRRAEAIKDALARDIDSSRIEAKGLGKQYPVASNSNEAGRAMNRRVTVTVLNPEKTTSTDSSTSTTESNSATGQTSQDSSTTNAK